MFTEIRSHDNIVRLLHVDDESDQRMMTKLFLEKNDPAIHVDSASSPEEALRMVESQVFDCIVSDYQMPVMDGIELARRIRETSSIPFLIYTGRGSEEVASAAFAAGVDDYVRKEMDPSHYEVLAKRVRTIVEKYKSEDKLRESEERYRSFVESSRDGIEAFHGTELLFANLQAARLHGFDSLEELMKAGFLERVVPEDREMIRKRALARQRGECVLPLHEFKVRLPDGSIRYLESSSSLFEYEGRPAVLSFIRDITNRIQNERRLKSLHIHALELSRAETLDEVYETTLDTIEKTLELKTADILVVEGDRLRQVARRGALPLDQELTLDGRGVTVRAVRTRRSQLVPDIRKDVDYVSILYPSAEKALSELAVPMKIGEEVVAVINVESPKLDAFTDVDQRLLEVATEHAASAMSRLRYTEKLRASEEMWKNLLKASMDAVSVVVGLKIAYVNQSYVRLLGLRDASEAIGRNALDFVAEEDREMIKRRALERQRGEEHPKRYKFRMLRADGAKIDVENHVTLIDYEGEPASLSFVRDVTKQRRMERELLESEARFRDVVDNALAWVWEVDADGKYVYSSSVVERILGYTPEEIIGKHFYDLFHPDDREELKEAIFEDFDKKRPHREFRNRTLHKNGETVWLSTSSVPMLDDAGNLIGYRGVDQDITEKVLAEEELRQYTEHLEEIVKERSRELIDAERIVAAGRVASMIGHDLRGTLQVIKNAVYLLKKRPKKTDETLMMIEGAVSSATQMIEEFRSQTRDTPLNLVLTDLVFLIDTVVKETQVPDFVNVVRNVGDGLEDVSLDPLKMRRVLDNLIGNAVDAMPGGGVLTLTADRRENEIVIKVSDTGVGIPEEEMSNLFKPFHTTKPKGIGLGLAYCRRTVEAHGGTIRVESEAGEGTTFTVTLPTKNIGDKI